MTHLTPIVTEIGLFKKEGTLCFLDGSSVYFTMSERKFRGTTTTYWKVDVNHPKSRQSLDSDQWPKIPTCPKTWIKQETVMFAYWLTEVSWKLIKVPVFRLPDGETEFVYPFEVSENDFSHALDEPEYQPKWGINDSWVRRARSAADNHIEMVNKQLSDEFVPMREANSDESELVARILSFEGDEKQLVQGLQRLGVKTDGLKKRNFVTKGMQFDNLEELIFNEQPG